LGPFTPPDVGLKLRCGAAHRLVVVAVEDREPGRAGERVDGRALTLATVGVGLREVSKALAGAGFLASSGKPFGAAAIARMVSGSPGRRL
jgi:hypothetical protein